MKKTITIIVCSLFVSFAFAQRPTAKIDQVKAFFNSTLYVVTDENPLSEYNAVIAKAMEKNWKITNFEIINYTDFESKRLDSKNSFLLLTEVMFPKDVAKYDFLSILIGGNYPSVNEMPEICTFPIGYSDADEDNSAYKIPAIIGFFNQHIKNIESNPKLLKDKKYKYYTKKQVNMTKKTFYIVSDEQLPELSTDRKLKSLYTGKIVVMGKDEIGNFIEKKMNNVVFLHKVGPVDAKTVGSRCYLIVMDANSTLYYFGFHKISEKAPNALTVKHWKMFNKFAK